MIDKETLTEDDCMYLPAVVNETSRMTDRNKKKPREPAATLEPEKINEILSINKQIRDLARKRAELKKKNSIEESKTDGETPREEPLPQRTPRMKPRIISDVRLISPKIRGRERDKEYLGIPLKRTIILSLPIGEMRNGLECLIGGCHRKAIEYRIRINLDNLPVKNHLQN